MKKIAGITLGIMTALGGFVDIGQIVFTMQAGALFGYGLMWTIALGTAAIIVYMEMCGRIALLMAYEVHFYSSGAIEEDWTREDLGENFFVAALGSVLGAVLTIALLVLGGAGPAAAGDLPADAEYDGADRGDSLWTDCAGHRTFRHAGLPGRRGHRDGALGRL